MVHFQYPGRSRVSLRHSGPGFGRLPSRPVPPGCGARPSHPRCTPGSTGFPQPRPQDDLQHRLPPPGDCPRAIRGQQKCGVPPVRHQPLDPALVAGPPGPLTEPGRPRRRKLDRHAFGRHVSEHPDALQRERAAHFKVSVGSIRHALGRMGATRKKNRPATAKGNPQAGSSTSRT